MAFCGDREDVVSAFMTATSSLLHKYDIDPKQIGRLECGTETLIDKSKSIKSNLMQLFGDNGDIEGVDNINACYGGTAALLNTIAWVQSPAWDGRYGLVVCGDIAMYEPGAARPTGGMGATAMLIGPNAPIVLEQPRASHFEHAWDFYKPNLHSEYPVVDGKLSITVYFRALDACWAGFQARHRGGFQLKDSDYYLFHSPFTKLVRKSFARLFQNEWLANRVDMNKVSSQHLPKPEWHKLTLPQTYEHNDMQKLFCDATAKQYDEKVVPSLKLAKQLGNSYTGSLYASLASLVCSVPDEDLMDRRATLFSYGSGAASTMFSFKFEDSVATIQKNLDLEARLKARRSVEAQEYLDAMILRENTHSSALYTPVGTIHDLFPGTYYLEHIDGKKRRVYAKKV